MKAYIFAWPTGRGENLETAISGGGPGSTGKEKETNEYIRPEEEEDSKMSYRCGKARES